MKKVLKELIKIAITVLIFFILFRRIPFHDVVSTLQGSKPQYFIIAGVLFFLYYFFFSSRWKTLLNAIGIKISEEKAYIYIIISFFFNNILPSAVGMDAVRSIYAGGKEKFSGAFASSIMERALGMSAILFIGLFSIFRRIENGLILFLIYLGLILLIFILYLVLTGIKFKWLKNFILKIKFLNLGEEIRKFYRALKEYRDKRRVIVIGFLLSMCVQMMIVFINYMIVKGLNLDISIFHLITYLPLITIVSLIPITINGLGLRESAYVLLFNAAGLPGNQSLSLSLMFYFISVIASISGGIAFLFLREKRKDRI